MFYLDGLWRSTHIATGHTRKSLSQKLKDMIQPKTVKMKTKNLIYPLLIMGLMLIFTLGCEKDDNIIYGDGVTDINGNEYISVVIGDQEWMAENLKTTTYKDGADIPNVTDDDEWSNLSTGGYCWYNNDYDEYGTVYGALYNWYAVETGNLCPEGWRVPTDNDWKILEGTVDSRYDVGSSEWNKTFRRRGNNAGRKLKATSGWHSVWYYFRKGTNDYGFSALPGTGRLYSNGKFVDGVGKFAGFWSSSENSGANAWFRTLRYDSRRVFRNNTSKGGGKSVRCIRDID